MKHITISGREKDNSDTPLLKLLDQLERLGVKAEVEVEFADLFKGGLSYNDSIILTFPDGSKFTLEAYGAYGYEGAIEVKEGKE